LTVTIHTAHAAELDEIARFIARQQESPESCVPFFGRTPPEVASEIEAWGASWPRQSLVAKLSESIVGFIGADVDPEQGRVWLHGPFAEPGQWDSLADVLLERVLTDVVPGEVGDLELAGDVANERLGDLARRHGFRRGKPSRSLEIGRDAISRLPSITLPALGADHHAEFVALHDKLFPGTYYSGAQLVRQHTRAEAIVLQLVESERLTGYAAGRADPSGEGYLDFLGVAEDARGAGRGRRLVTSICQRLVGGTDATKVALTVYEDNAPALALYEGLGFAHVASLVGYRRRPGDPETAP
jgi:ribosomal protein S18 acetylase RimI-like enzyme